MVVGIALLVLIITLFIGIPIPYAFFASSAYLIFVQGYDPGFLLPFGFSKMGSIVLLAIPLFIMAGGLMNKGRIGEKLVEVVEVFVGRFKGGLGAVMVISCAIFGAISGSSSATISCIGSIMLPKLYAAGYPKGHCSALIASSGVLGILIPPSMLMILYAWMGNQSVLASFLATVLPGLMLMTLLSTVNMVLLRKNQEIQVSANYDLKTTVKLFGQKSYKALPALMMPVIILGGIYGGIMTPTEAAAVSVLYSIPVGFFIYKGLDKKGFMRSLIESTTTTGVIMVMLFSVMILSRLYTMENLPQKIIELFTAISSNKMVIMLMVNLFMIIMGMLMDDVSSVLLTTPILLPVVTHIGVDPIHFAAILGVNLGMGNITPPCAPLLYLSGRIGGAKVNEMLKPTMYMILFAWLPTLIVTTLFPSFGTWLPNLVLGR
ncbi:TRAP transporter large permease [Candidatus Formimonas warabiya]|uniref:C4-dicarboxylate ABC transporter permease n=1 Tax=Formimonas warabiya TaxID=1761012 RepID=A0A3G1KXT8_FORW1|nr:TRAP transporter large permease [Candidatus Formimonas warabiya]ATW27025.1 C4-dicarboxylate ABC transporter permease [Candidatus Formimonas warabiya]